MSAITVAEAISDLRSQLAEAQQEGSGKELRFKVKSVEVELAVVLKTGTEGGAGVKAWVVDVSGKAKRDDETSHRVKLVLEPTGRDGEPTEVFSRKR